MAHLQLAQSQFLICTEKSRLLEILGAKLAISFTKSVTTSHCPIRLADLPVKVFTKFLYHHLVAESNGKHYLLKIGIGGYRSALQDIF
jgi:hypothetical protein